MRSRTGTCLIDFPPELLTAICRFVPCRMVVLCRSVCRRLRDVIDGSVELQYRIELDQDGMINGPRHSAQPTTTSERLGRLRQLRDAWKTLSWTRCVTVSLPGPCCAYELVGGIFCKTQPGKVDDETFNHFAGSRAMSTTWLPSGRDGDGRSVVRDDLGIPTRDFAMDPSQDLMVLFKDGQDVGQPLGDASVMGVLELHVRTLSTNQVHPDAKEPVLFTEVVYPIKNVFVQVVDDVVGAMFCIDASLGRPRITIWNWKTGNLIVDESEGLPLGTWDFSFINNRTLLVTTVYGSGALEVFSFSTTLTHVATFHLPPVRLDVRIVSIDTHTGPFLAHCPAEKPFMASNEDRIHVVTVQYVRVPTVELGQRMRARVCVFMHNRMLLGHLGPVSWVTWGPTHARMVAHGYMFQWLRYVHGQRVVLIMRTGDTGQSSVLKLLDFNVRRGMDGVAEPTRIDLPNIFANVVESGLPYREVCREVDGEYSGVMIDDERLVGLKYAAFLTGDMKEIDVFTM